MRTAHTSSTSSVGTSMAPDYRSSVGVLLVAMHRLGRERGQADGNVLRTTRLRRAVADPLTRMRDDRLSGTDVEHATFMLDADQPVQDEGDLLELRALSRLQPAFGRHHARDADFRVAGVHATRELLDPLRLVAGGFDHGRLCDQCWHMSRGP